MSSKDSGNFRSHVADMKKLKYGFLISNFAEQDIVRKALPGWNIGFKGRNAVSLGEYGPWFAGGVQKS